MISTLLFSADTGWEFPEMYAHLDLVEKKTGIKIIRLHPDRPFNYWMFKQRVIARDGLWKGEVCKIGNGWPSTSRRWCTREKIKVIARYQKTVENCVPCVGYAVDEVTRPRRDKIRYPLDEYVQTEKDCLEYCKSLGYHWDGLYDVFDRVSCFCCPLQGKKTLKKLREHYPSLYQQTLEWDMMQPRHNPGFVNTESVVQLEEAWRIDEMLHCGDPTWLAKEDKQLRLF